MKLKIKISLIISIIMIMTISAAQDLNLIRSMFAVDNNIKNTYIEDNSYWCITQDGSIYVMGDNQYGKLGIGDKTNRTTAVQLTNDSDWQSISPINQIIANNNSIYYLAQNGWVYVSGRNNYGQLGVGHTEDVTKITRIKGEIQNQVISKIITDGSSTFFISSTGEVYVTGRNENGQLGLGIIDDVKTVTKLTGEVEGVRITDVAIGGSRTYFLGETGAVYITGYDPYLQASPMYSTTNINKVTRLNELSGIIITKIIAGESTYYLSDIGEVYVSGKNNYGQLGLGVGDDISTITKITGALTGVKVTQIVAGESTYYISDTGDIYATGRNDKGQLGLGNIEKVPAVTKVSALEGKTINKIITTGDSTYYISSTGAVYVAGNNEKGQLGLENNIISTATRLDGAIAGKRIANILNDRNSVYYIAESGEVYVSGVNSYKKLGIENENNQRTIVKSDYWTTKQLKDIKDEKYITTRNIHTLISDINSGANAPEVYQGLYPVKYGASGETIFTNTDDPEWYNYTQGKWANAVTLDQIGQMNPSAATEANITGYYVWIPRYAYLIRTGYNTSDTGRIDVRFLTGTTNADRNGKTYYSVSDLDNEYEKWEEIKSLTYVGDRQMDYLVHPAFYFEEELTGIWVGKTEASISEKADLNRDGIVNDTDADIIRDAWGTSDEFADINGSGSIDISDISELVGYTNNVSQVLTKGEASDHISLNNAFDRIREMTSKYETYDEHNLYGLASDTNTHLIKPTEYGAVAYLVDSIYADNSANNYYKVEGINNGKEYTAGGLEGISTGIAIDKYKDIYTRDESGNIVDVKGSAFLETSDGTTSWNGGTVSIDQTAGIVVKDGAYGVAGSDGNSTDVGFRVALTKGTNANKVKKVYIDNNSFWWLMENGDVWVMGENRSGELGLGDTEWRGVPEKLELDSEGNKIGRIKEIIIKKRGTNNLYNSVLYHSEEGNVYVAGYNGDGVLGTGDNNNVLNATKVNIQQKVKKIIIHPLMYRIWYLTEEGDVYVCGANGDGVLGTGDNNKVLNVTKVSIPYNAKIKDVIVEQGGNYNNVRYLDEEGNVYVCGGNNYGVLGTGDTNDVTTVTKISVPNDEKIEKILFYNWSTWYLDEKGNVYVSGYNNYGQLGTGDTNNVLNVTKLSIPNDEKIIDIIVKSNSVWYLGKEGNVYVSGYNNYGQLGTGDTSNVKNVTQVNIPGNEKIEKIIFPQKVHGNYLASYVWYLDKDGNVYASGRNSSGELGTGNTNNVTSVAKISVPQNAKIVDIIPYGSTSLSVWYLDKDGNVYVSGYNGAGQLGTGNTNNVTSVTKISVPQNAKIVDIIFYGDAAFVAYYLDKNGNVYVSGKNDKGQLRTGDTNNITTVTRSDFLTEVRLKEVDDEGYYISKDGNIYVQIEEENTIEQVPLKKSDIQIEKAIFKEGHLWILTQEGKVYVAGKNSYGELGMGDTNIVSVLTQIVIPGDAKIEKIITNGYSVWYIDEDGFVYVAGKNSYGQLGTGDTNDVTTVTKISVPNNEKIIDIVPGTWYISETGNVYVSGENTNYRFGIGYNYGNITTLTKVNLSSITKVINDFGSTWYISEAGKVYVCGTQAGQFGTGDSSTKHYVTQVAVPGNAKIVEVVGRQQDAWYIDENGKVYVAGLNSYGVLGVGHTDRVTTLTQVNIPGGAKIKELIQSYLNTYQMRWLTETGDVYVSGSNGEGYYGGGYLGIGTTEDDVITVTKLSIPGGVKINKVVVGDYSTLYLGKNGSVYYTGQDEFISLEVASTPRKLTISSGEKINDIIGLYGLSESVWFIGVEGTVYVGGSSAYGQLGNGSVSGNTTSINAITIGEEQIAEIISNGNSTIYITESDKAYVTGKNNDGELGLGHVNNILIPVQLKEAEKFPYSTIGNITSIYGNATSTIFEEEDGDIYVIGHASNGKLGITGKTWINEATKIGITDVKDAGVGGDFSVFLKDDGSIVGYGNSSKNGNGLTNIAQIAVGYNHAVFLTNTGSIINKGTTTSAYVNGVDNIEKIVAGENHTVVLKKDGTTKSFGQNDSGLTNVVDIFAGKNMTVFVTNDGKVRLMTNNTLTELSVKNIVYAELNGDKPYFVAYNRDLVDKDGNIIEVWDTEMKWVKEVKGNVVLNERKRVYDLSKM